ncbi:MAG: hypothetical protein HQL75_07670 [Magnetococcales bacterium]|nr:hypothetical protein [Magnetococcales bacterium]
MVSPEPLERFVPYAKDGRLFDRLVQVIGTPGSGKTTLASLLEYPRLSLAVRSGQPEHKEIVAMLHECCMVVDQHAVIVATRLPMESEYRDYRELPYPPELRHRLFWTMIQARAMHGWVRGIMRSEQIQAEAITFHYRSGTDSLHDAIGGHNGCHILTRASIVEKAIYNIGAAIFPIPEKEFTEDAREPYRPLDIIEKISFIGKDDTERSLRPLLILDDVHVLHPEQRQRLEKELGRRELSFARWLLMRLDALPFQESLNIPEKVDSETKSGLQHLREVVQIRMQDDERIFKKMIEKMANRYLHQMDIFARRQRSLTSLLSTEQVSLPIGKMEKLRKKIDAIQKEHQVTPERRTQLLDLINQSSCQDVDLHDDDIQLALLSILMHRYVNRIPKQRSLFDDDNDPDPARPLKVDSSIVHAARLHLFHKFDRVYYYGFQCLINAASQNPEIFLKLAAPLVALAETRFIRGKDGTLDASTQQKRLRERAREIHDQEWSFPRKEAVRRLTRGMAKECLATTLVENARNGAGNNAFGIPQYEFNDLVKNQQDFAEVLHYAVAYNAIFLKQNYRQGGKEWCLLQLGGTLILEYGLTWMQGGFLERSVNDLVKILGEQDRTA